MSERPVTLPLGLVLSAALLSACTVGPDYVRPTLPVPAQFSAPPLDTGNFPTPISPVAEFWVGFSDPILSALMTETLSANHELRIALARLEQARALSRQSRRNLAPTVRSQAAYQDARLAADEAPGLPASARDVELISADVTSFWELDLFGRVRRSVEASQAHTQAVAADLHALQISITAELASTYFELRGVQAELGVARRNADNQAETLQLTQARLDAGSGTEFDVARASAQLENSRARIPVLVAAQQVAANRLAVLSGQPPGSLQARLQPVQPIPELPEQVAIGTPSELLRRRPDIQAAERRLASATARIGVTTADLFPRLSLNGVLGSAAANLGDLFTHSAARHQLGAQIDWAFLDLARVRDHIAAADAVAAGQLANYEGTVLLALEETENALLRYQQSRQQSEHLARSLAAAQRAGELARLRFDGGVADFLQVLDSERSLLATESALVSSRTQAATALIAVYRAIAGGWSTAPEPESDHLATGPSRTIKPMNGPTQQAHRQDAKQGPST